MSNIYKGHDNVAALKYLRKFHACTIFRSSAYKGRPVAIVAGSEGGPVTDTPKDWGTNTVEVWDFTIVGSSWVKSMLLFY